MYQATRNFLKRNRTNLAVGVGLAGAGYLAVQYIGTKLSEARSQMMSDRVARENLHRRFQQNQEDCSFTVQALLPTATEHILQELPVEKLTQELQQKKAARIAKSGSASQSITDTGSDVSTNPPASKEDDAVSLRSFASESFSGAKEYEDQTRKTKTQLWDDIKIGSLTRFLTLLYTLSLLTLLTRVQLNLLGRKNYLYSVVSLAERDGEPTIRIESHEDMAAEGYGGEVEINRQYLTFSWWLLHRGWRMIMEKVDIAVRQVFGPLTPRDTISLGKFRELMTEVRKLVEAPVESKDGEPSSPWLPFLLPPRDQEGQVIVQSGIVSSDSQEHIPSAELRKLLDETSDLIDSPMANTVLSHMIGAGLALLIDNRLTISTFRQQAMVEDSDSGGRITEVVEDSATTKFASVLAVLARQAHLIGSGAQNEYLKMMETGSELEAFSALVYSSNFDYAQGDISKSRVGSPGAT